jgi:hypothetical protein
VRPEPTVYLWRDRVPLGALTLIVGRPGLGKSTHTVGMAAQVTRGTLPGDLEGTPRRVLFATAEDHVAGTIVPRLMAAGADLALVEFLTVTEDGVEGLLRLPEDVDRIAARAAEVGDLALVVVDPLVAFLGEKVNSWRDQDVRRAIAPLARLAERERLAVEPVLHVNKAQTTDVLDRVGGSVAFTAAARSVLVFGTDPNAPDGEGGSQRVLVHVKCNVGPLAPTLVYRLEGRAVRGDEGTVIPTSRAVEVGLSDVTADELLRRITPDERSERDEAQDFLRAELALGPQPVSTLKQSAQRLGITDATLKRAKKKLGLAAERVGGVAGEGHWQWSLPKGLTKGLNNNGEPLRPLSPLSDPKGAKNAKELTDTKEPFSEPLSVVRGDAP